MGKYYELSRDYANLLKDSKIINEENLKLNKIIEQLVKAVYGDCNYCKFDGLYNLNEKCEHCNSYAGEMNAWGCYWELKDFD